MDDCLFHLTRSALFAGVSEADAAALCDSLRCRRAFYPKGSVILRRGEYVERAGLVLSGVVQAERNGADGALRIVARHGALELFGDMLTASGIRKSPVDVIAAEDTEVLFLPLAELMRDGAPDCREARTRIRLNLLSELSEKYWALNAQLELLRAPTLRVRLARRLLAARRAQESNAFTLPGTRETLAAELGVNRSALSRELGKMMREGLFTARRGHFVLHDVAELERLAAQ